jgi:putative FmdB family regulatory protein
VPIHDFACGACAARFEELVRGDALPPCPQCGSADVERLLSVSAPPAKFGLRGGDARRSEAARRARREKRRGDG